MLVWLSEHAAFMWWLFAASAVMFVGSLIALPILVTRMPADYFVRNAPLPAGHPVLRWTLRIGKNALGLILVTGGLAMLVLPGQGVLAILIGLSLLDFPGKRALELWIVRRNAVLKSINWLRRRAGRPPLEVPDSHC